MQNDIAWIREKYKTSLANADLSKAISWIRQLLLRLDTGNDINDYNGARELIAQIKLSLKLDDYELISQLEEVERGMGNCLEFKKNKMSLQYNNCDAKVITKREVIKCAIETDYTSFR